MADFFYGNNDFYSRRTQILNSIQNQIEQEPEEEQKLQQENKRNIGREEAKQALEKYKAEKSENYNRYGIVVPDEQYEVYNNIISQAPDPETAKEESYKLGIATRFAEWEGVPIDEAYSNIDYYMESYFPNKATQKDRWEALCDMFEMGKNNVELGKLGNKIMGAYAAGDTEMIKALEAQVDAYNQSNANLQANIPHRWEMAAFEAGAQSLPFTGATAGAGLIGNFIAPGLGDAASFLMSSYLCMGQEYLDMLANGSDHETAKNVATISGLVQGLIEADLGITKGIAKGGAKLFGKEVSEDFLEKNIKELANKAYKKFHFGQTKKVIANYLLNRGMDVLGEGTEEFLQEVTSIAGKELAATLDGYDIPDDDFKQIVTQTLEAFKGGVLGAVGLGFIPGMNPARLKAYSDLQNVRVLKDAAEVFDSEEMFKKSQKNNPIFDELDEKQKNEELHGIWQSVQARKEAAADKEAANIAEGLDAGVGAEQRKVTVDENGNEIEEGADPVAHDDAGRLFTKDEVYSDEQGNVTGGTFVVGDRTKAKESGNRYGYINYTTDENGNITIEDFKMNPDREGLRGEVFDEFAREHPDVYIEWNAIGSDMQAAKEELVKANPSGAKNGLNYYSSEDLADIQTEKDLGHLIRGKIHNIKVIRYFDENNQAKIRMEKTQLTSDQVASVVALFKTMAQEDNVSLSDFISNKFVDGIFGTQKDFNEDIAAYNQKHINEQVGENEAMGGLNWKKIGPDVKAVIYAGENADYLTLMHELAHFYQDTMTGDLKTEAEKAFDVQDGNWEALSKYKDDDGNYMTKREAFAYGFQDWITTGRVKNNTWKNIFEKFAKFLAQAYTRLKQHLNLTPEIESVFEKMLGDDESIMAKALKAAQEEEGEWKAMLKRNAEEKEAQKKKAQEETERQAQAEREEASEYTDYESEEAKAPSTEELLKGIEDAENEARKNTEKTNAIDDALENTNLTDEKKEQIAEVLKDDNSTRVEKAQAVTEAAASVYENEWADDSAIPDDMAFQIIGEIGAQNLDEDAAEGVSRMQNLVIAKQMEKDKKDAQTVRLATGWEKGVDGKWRYEIDDNKIRLYDEQFFPKRHLVADAEYDKIEQAIRDADYNLEAIPVQDRQYWEAYNDAESEYVRQFIDFEENGKQIWKQTVNLERILDAPELFKSYPQLKKIQFVMQELPDGTMAKWENNKNRITVSPFARRNHLLHEIQHAIQDIEGFSKGGNASQFETKDFSKEKIESLTKQAHELFNKQNEDWKKLVRKYNEASINQDYETTSQISDELENDTAFNEYVNLMSKATSIKEGTTSVSYVKTPKEQYRSLAGETEARNVQRRINFTPEERRKTLLAATEDVAREDQIILEKAARAISAAIDDNYNKAEQLDKAKAVEITTTDILPEFVRNFDKSDNDILTKTIDWGLAQVGTNEIEHAQIGTVNVYKKGIRNSIFHGFSNPLKARLFKKLPEIIPNSIVINTEIKDGNIKSYVLAGKLKVDGIDYFVTTVVKVDSHGNKYYNHSTIKKSELGQRQTRKNAATQSRPDTLSILQDILSVKHNQQIDQNTDEISFQRAFHGSGADFDKFDTEHYGLSGEGSMSFGYGTYVTDSEEIARDYAERQKHEKISRKSVLERTIESDKELYEKGENYLKQLFSDLEDVRKRDAEIREKYGENSVEYQNFLFYEEEKTIQEQYERALKSHEERKRYITENEKELSEISPTGKLYTVELPDDGYIQWSEPVTKEIIDRVAPVYAEEMYNRWINDSESQDGFIVYNDMQKRGIRESFEKELYREIEVDPTYDGGQLYNHIQRKLEYYDKKNGAKLASKLLNRAGITGIKYLAGTIHGNGNGAYNYVIFNDDDAQIVEKLLFQTQAELMDEARGFDTWQEFMENCETYHSDDAVSPIPYNSADAQWYQSFWEQAKGIETEQEKREKAVSDKVKKDGTIPTAVDALFTTAIKSNPEMLDNFLKMVSWIDAQDLNSDEYARSENEEDAQERERLERLKDFISITLSDYNWQTAMKRIQSGNEIAEGLRKRLIGEITDNFKVRDFRSLYAEVMEESQFAVAPEDSITAILNKKLKKYHDIVSPNDDISRWSPEKRKQLAEQLQNKEIAAKIRNGSLKLDDELDAYIKSLEKQTKDIKKQLDELEAETKADYQRLADKERRDLLKVHEELLKARSKVDAKNSEINRKINKGLKITDKYKRESQNLTANYDELFRKFTDLKNSIQITAEVQEALNRQVQVAGLRDDLNAKQKEKNITAEVKKMRIQLVKRTMRRVPFNRIDYENAKKVIAIQRMLEPNLLGGVNKFIGIDSPYLRGIVSQIVTDKEFKEKILNYLGKTSKSSKAFADFKKKLEELKSIKDFDSWTAKERKAAIRYLPKENWVKDLNLLQLAKEREESIDLDIGMEEFSKPKYDEKTGEQKTYKDADGNEHIVTETAFKLKYSDEIGKMVQDAVGADMFDKIVNMPFSEWTTEDLEKLAQRIDELYTEGRDLKAAKDEARKRAADEWRKKISEAINETGITINDDDTPEEAERKEKRNNKILGLNSNLVGTEAGKQKGILAKLDRLLHGYEDRNVLRFARMLDGQSEGANVYLLYRKEDECYNNKMRSMNARGETINKVMKDNKITEGDLAKSIKIESLNTEFTVDELLYFLAADKDYVEDEKKVQRGLMGLDANDDYAATSRNAVMFGNMMSDTASQEQKEAWAKLDEEMNKAIENGTLTLEQKQLLEIGQLDTKPGTSQYISYCKAKWGTVLQVANQFITDNPKYKALMEAIEADYASQYERMNEVSINEFNTPVHRVKAYVPLVRREQNGETLEAQMKEDILGAHGVGKQGVDKGMTQRRTSISPLFQKPVQTGLFRTWGDSIERTEHFIAYAPYVRQLNAIYKSRDAAYLKRYIERRYGKYAMAYINDYIAELANPNAGKVCEKGAELLHVLRGKTAPAYLGWKASGIIKQGLTSPWPYMQFVNPAQYVAAATKFWTNPKMREAIEEKSVYMKNRRMDPVNDLIDEMNDNAKNALDRGWGKFTKMGMQGLEWIDYVCVAPGWLACYEKKYNQLQNASEARYEAKLNELKERNMNADVTTSEYLTPEQMESVARKEMLEDIETEAVTYADDCTRQCQPSNRLTDLAPMFKDKNEFMRAFLQFQTSLNVIWQNIRYDMPYAVKQKQFWRIVGTILGYVSAGIFMNSVMDGIGSDDDDDKQALRNLIYYSTTQFTDAIPMIGSEITNLNDKLITGKRGFAQSGTDMTPSATKLLSVLTSAKKGNWTKAAALTAEGIGLYLGAPVSGTKEIYKLLGSPVKNGNVDLKRGVSDVYGIAGDIIGE